MQARLPVLMGWRLTEGHRVPLAWGLSPGATSAQLVTNPLSARKFAGHPVPQDRLGSTYRALSVCRVILRVKE